MPKRVRVNTLENRVEGLGATESATKQASYLNSYTWGFLLDVFDGFVHTLKVCAILLQKMFEPV